MTGLDIKALMHRMAELKNIPLWKVIRNAARDFVQAAYNATPLAQTATSTYYKATRYEQTDEVYTTKTGKVKTRKAWALDAGGKRTSIGKSWYIPASKIGSTSRSKWEKGGIDLRQVKVRKGWSKATWIGLMVALGMNAKNRPNRVPRIVEQKSAIEVWRGGKAPSITISDELKIDHFGRATTMPAWRKIEQAGYKLAAERMEKETEKMLKQAWRGQR